MIDIKYEKENDRSAAYDGKELVGVSSYSPSDKLWIIDHTEVREDYGSQGIAGKLVDKLVQVAREEDIKIMPLCPYAKRKFDENRDYDDVRA